MMMVLAVMIDIRSMHITIQLRYLKYCSPKRLISSLLFSSGSEMIMSSGSIALEERRPLTRELAILPQPMNPILGLFERNALSLMILLNVEVLEVGDGDCDEE